MRKIVLLENGISKIDTLKTYDQKFKILKPNGLWYSFDNYWDTFLSLTDFRYTLKYDKCVEIFVDTKKFICIDTVEILVKFDNIFSDNRGFINWEDVSNHYDGIEIGNNYPIIEEFCNSHYPNKLHWFRCFDIPSGCVWNLSAILNQVDCYQ